MYNMEKQASGSVVYEFEDLEFTLGTEFFFAEGSIEIEYKCETERGYWAVQDHEIYMIHKIIITNTDGYEVAPYPALIDAAIKTLEEKNREKIDDCILDEVESSEYY